MGVELSREKYDYRQIRRWGEITDLLRAVDEQSLALDREISRTSHLLMAYCQNIEARETDKASDLKLMRWAKRVASAYPRALSIISHLNDLLEAAAKHNGRPTKQAEFHG